MATSNTELRSRLDELRARQQRARLNELRVKKDDVSGGDSAIPGDSGDGSSGVLDKIQAVVEPLGTVLSGAVAEPIAGLAGLATQNIFNLAPSPEERSQNVQEVREALTFQPRSEAGQEGLEALGEFITPVAETIEEGRKFLGDTAFEATDSPLLAAAATALPEGLLSLIPASRAIPKATKTPRPKKATVKEEIAERIKAGDTDRDLAKFIVEGKNKVKKDKFATEAIKQGFDDGVISAIKGSTRTDKIKMINMLNITKRSRKNALFGSNNRPSDIAGDSLLQRVKHIKKVNRFAGREIDRVAKTLRGKEIDLVAPVEQFANKLDDFGVKIIDDGKGGLKPDFSDSALAPGDRGPIKEVIRQMNRVGKRGPIDAFSAHQMKRIIDDNVTFGKKQTGLSGSAERALKEFRNGIDKVLDETFPEYNTVNTAYADTIGALDSLQNVAGKKMDLFGKNADKAVGTLLRRLMSNAQSRVNLIDAVDEIEGIAKKYSNASKGGKELITLDRPLPPKAVFTDNIRLQMLFADELDAVFKPAARTSLAGVVGKEVERAANRTILGTAAEGAGKLVEKARGISEENAIKAIDRLLKR